MITEKFDDLFDFAKKSKVKAGDGLKEGNYPFYTSSSILKKRLEKAQHFEDALIFGTGGSASVHFANEPFATSTDCIVALKKKDKEINEKFVFYYLFGNIHILEKGFKGAGLKHISKKYIQALDIPIYPIETQNKIVALLDKASALVQKRANSIAVLDELLRAQFLDMFGDPVLNPKGWDVESLQECSVIMRDGPFGSNLKTEHYSDEGIRIIRLQNIGVNEFVNSDKKYVSEKHYTEVLLKHTCLPGDVIIGTLGVPNLRACILPEKIEKAVNKADCVQFRANELKVIPEYIADILNHPGSLFLAQNFIKGQTRSRISKGMLAKIKIPIPSLTVQKSYLNIRIKIKRQLDEITSSKTELENLYNGLLQRAFNGQLNFNVDAELDILLAAIDINEEENDIRDIAAVYASRLLERLEKQEFEDQAQYQQAKHVAFQLLKEGVVCQELDGDKVKMKLA